MPQQKAQQVVDSGPCDVLHLGLSRHLPHFQNDADRDIDRVEMQADPDGAIYVGYWGATARLMVGVALDYGSRTAEIMLTATKRQADAISTPLGQTGPDVGNSALVARLLHVAVFFLRAVGIEEIVNDPVDARVRAHYTTMGFVNGERLPLGDAARLEQTFQFVEQTYQPVGLSLALPPLPLL